MSLCMSWSTFRPGTTPDPCPRCGVPPRQPVVFIRHEFARFAGHAPAWIHCDCGHTYAPAVATGADCPELLRDPPPAKPFRGDDGTVYPF
jgi:hypothetical protein